MCFYIINLLVEIKNCGELKINSYRTKVVCLHYLILSGTYYKYLIDKHLSNPEK